jgi:hypothetical protein
MFITHKVFLKWLLYITVMIFIMSALGLLGIVQLTFAYDHIYLGSMLVLMYLAAEGLAAKEAIRISQENVKTNRLREWLKSHSLVKHIYVNGANRVTLRAHEESFEVEPSYIADHIQNLVTKSRHGLSSINQRILLDGLADRVYFRSLIGDFISARIVWIGILATILGVIMAFWPFVNINGLDIEAIRQNLGPFFRGVAVAFLPTAVSFVCKVALDFNTRILMAGANELLDTITTIGEAHIVPLLEQQVRHGRILRDDMKLFGVTVGE